MYDYNLKNQITPNIKIKINNLNVFYGQFHALKNINLNILNKQITAFIGPSSCGKSTCLKTINRMNNLVANCNMYFNKQHCFIDKY